MLCIRNAMDGVNFTHRILTVAGEVRSPVVLRVPVGTALSECLSLAGGTLSPDPYVLSGGPLMGKPAGENEVVTKTTSGIIVLGRNTHLANLEKTGVAHMINRARSACIQCSLCTQMCPRYLSGHPLQPHRIMRELGAAGSLEAMLGREGAKQALICCECGICTLFACPMQLQPSRINTLLKGEYAAAGTRCPKGPEPPESRPGREQRKVPSRRIAARAGVLSYYDCAIDRLEEHEPQEISPPLSQHIGAPSLPVVEVGDRVAKGQLIAECPPGKLGANLHAGIAGTVTAITNRITIRA